MLRARIGRRLFPTAASWLLAALSAACSGAEPAGEPQARLYAGVARIDITPDVRVAQDGYQNPENRISEGVHDRLYARAFVFSSGSNRFVLVSCDLTSFISAPYFLNPILERFGLQPDELFLCATHTHSGPVLSLNRTYPHPNNLPYTESLRQRLVKVIDSASRALAPVRLLVGRGESHVGVSRRRILGPGRVEMSPNPDGAADPEVLVLRLMTATGDPLGALFSYSCHSRSLRSTNRLISGDILGIAAQYMERSRGGNFIGAAFAGASGDIDPIHVVSGFDAEPGSPPETERLGAMLGKEVVRVLDAAREEPLPAPVRSAARRFLLPRRIKGQTGPVMVAAARIGDVGLVGLDCEASVEIGLAIKAASPFKHTFVATICNGWSGYLPVAHQYPEGGYEVQHTGFAPEAAELLVKETVRLLTGLRDR